MLASLVAVAVLIPLLLSFQPFLDEIEIAPLYEAYRDHYLRSDFERSVYFHLQLIKNTCSFMKVEECFAYANEHFLSLIVFWNRYGTVYTCDTPIAVVGEDIILSCDVKGRIGGAEVYIPKGVGV